MNPHLRVVSKNIVERVLLHFEGTSQDSAIGLRRKAGPAGQDGPGTVRTAVYRVSGGEKPGSGIDFDVGIEQAHPAKFRRAEESIRGGFGIRQVFRQTRGRTRA